jgi:hypothetical protein
LAGVVPFGHGSVADAVARGGTTTSFRCNGFSPSTNLDAAPETSRQATTAVTRWSSFEPGLAIRKR